ncbi:hypothetical protein V8E36_004821 [Tilletia maclaganii]
MASWAVKQESQEDDNINIDSAAGGSVQSSGSGSGSTGRGHILLTEQQQHALRVVSPPQPFAPGSSSHSPELGQGVITLSQLSSLDIPPEGFSQIYSSKSRLFHWYNPTTGERKHGPYVSTYLAQQNDQAPTQDNDQPGTETQATKVSRTKDLPSAQNAGPAKTKETGVPIMAAPQASNVEAAKLGTRTRPNGNALTKLALDRLRMIQPEALTITHAPDSALPSSSTASDGPSTTPFAGDESALAPAIAMRIKGVSAPSSQVESSPVHVESQPPSARAHSPARVKAPTQVQTLSERLAVATSQQDHLYQLTIGSSHTSSTQNPGSLVLSASMSMPSISPASGQPEQPIPLLARLGPNSADQPHLPEQKGVSIRGVATSDATRDPPRPSENDKRTRAQHDRYAEDQPRYRDLRRDRSPVRAPDHRRISASEYSSQSRDYRGRSPSPPRRNLQQSDRYIPSRGSDRYAPEPVRYPSGSSSDDARRRDRADSYNRRSTDDYHPRQSGTSQSTPRGSARSRSPTPSRHRYTTARYAGDPRWAGIVGTPLVPPTDARNASDSRPEFERDRDRSTAPPPPALPAPRASRSPVAVRANASDSGRQRQGEQEGARPQKQDEVPAPRSMDDEHHLQLQQGIETQQHVHVEPEKVDQTPIQAREDHVDAAAAAADLAEKARQAKLKQESEKKHLRELKEKEDRAIAKLRAEREEQARAWKEAQAKEAKEKEELKLRVEREKKEEAKRRAEAEQKAKEAEAAERKQQAAVAAKKAAAETEALAAAEKRRQAEQSRPARGRPPPDEDDEEDALQGLRPVQPAPSLQARLDVGIPARSASPEQVQKGKKKENGSAAQRDQDVGSSGQKRARETIDEPSKKARRTQDTGEPASLSLAERLGAAPASAQEQRRQPQQAPEGRRQAQQSPPVNTEAAPRILSIAGAGRNRQNSELNESVTAAARLSPSLAGSPAADLVTPSAQASVGSSAFGEVAAQQALSEEEREEMYRFLQLRMKYTQDQMRASLLRLGRAPAALGITADLGGDLDFVEAMLGGPSHLLAQPPSATAARGPGLQYPTLMPSAIAGRASGMSAAAGPEREGAAPIVEIAGRARQIAPAEDDAEAAASSRAPLDEQHVPVDHQPADAAPAIVRGSSQDRRLPASLPKRPSPTPPATQHRDLPQVDFHAGASLTNGTNGNGQDRSGGQNQRRGQQQQQQQQASSRVDSRLDSGRNDARERSPDRRRGGPQAPNHGGGRTDRERERDRGWDRSGLVAGERDQAADRDDLRDRFGDRDGDSGRGGNSLVSRLAPERARDGSYGRERRDQRNDGAGGGGRGDRGRGSGGGGGGGGGSNGQARGRR